MSVRRRVAAKGDFCCSSWSMRAATYERFSTNHARGSMARRWEGIYHSIEKKSLRFANSLELPDRTPRVSARSSSSSIPPGSRCTCAVCSKVAFTTESADCLDNCRGRLGKEGVQSSDYVSRLLQLGVLGFGFFQNRDVGVGVLPESEEILVGGTGGRDVSFENAGAGEAEMSEGSSC